MKINELNSALAHLNEGLAIEKKKAVDKDNIFANMINGVIAAQGESKSLTQDFIQGKDVELHEVMVAGEKARTSLDLLVEIRNKAIDMYKELTRMQI